MWGRASSAERSGERLPAGRQGLAERRRLRRRRVLAFSSILLLLLLAAAVYGLWRPSMRISHVTMYGTDQALAELAMNAMQGTHLGIVPRDSTLFVPEGSIRASLMAAHSDIAAVSIFKNGLTGLSIKIDYRVPVARWCGLAPTEGVDEYCYLFDANGFVFAAADGVATSTQTVNNFTFYAPLEGETLEPLRATLARASQLPAVFDFARKFATLGSPVTRVVVRGDEIEDILASGTRIIYVLGDEQNAYTALASARANFSLTDGSIEYIDLRFPGKVYLKKLPK